MQDELSFVVTLVRPPAGVWFRLRRGKTELVPPAAEGGQEVSFVASARVGRRPDGSPNFLGPFVQGGTTDRHFKINAGTLAGQAESCWTRAIKVPLAGIDQRLIEAALALPGAVMAARIHGTARDGGPVCATVPLLDGGWQVVSEWPATDAPPSAPGANDREANHKDTKTPRRR
jgi:hypothetical protein